MTKCLSIFSMRLQAGFSKDNLPEAETAVNGIFVMSLRFQTASGAGQARFLAGVLMAYLSGQANKRFIGTFPFCDAEFRLPDAVLFTIGVETQAASLKGVGDHAYVEFVREG